MPGKLYTQFRSKTTIPYLSCESSPGGGEVDLSYNGEGIRGDLGVGVPRSQEEAELFIVVNRLLTNLNHKPGTYKTVLLLINANLSHCLKIDFISGRNCNICVKQVYELCSQTLRYEVTTQQWIQDRLYSIHFLYDQSFPKPDSQFQGCCKVGILKERHID